MIRSQRVLVLTIVAVALVAACRKKPETMPAPAPTSGPAPAETCNAACRDSIARARARDDSIARARSAASAAEDARRRAAEAAKTALTAKILFDYDQADLTAESRAVLDGKLPVLRANPGVRIRVSGHADERGSDDYNLALGQRRAAAAKRYLTDQGIDPARIETVSYGETRPAVQGADENAFRQNRRDEFEITAGGENIVGVAR